MNTCAACLQAFPESLPLLTGGYTKELGWYYEGPEVCDACLEIFRLLTVQAGHEPRITERQKND